jgi:hypothetical protein
MKTRWIAAFAAIALCCGRIEAQGPVINDPANGLTQTFSSGAAITPGQIVKLNGTGQVIPVTTSDTASPIGIAATGTNSAYQTIIVTIGGSRTILVDGACIIGQKVQISAITAGYGNCSSSPTLGTVGLALAAVSAAGQVSVQLQIGGSSSNGGGTATNGVGGSANPASPAKAFYLYPSCLSANTGQCFQSPGNTQQVADCGWTVGPPSVVTCTGSHFTSADVGKRAFGYKTCDASVNLAANSNNLPMTTTTPLTIATFNSATSVTLSGAAVNAVTISGSFPKGGCFIWGNPDDSGAVLMDAAMQASLVCPKAELGNANYMFTTYHFVANPPACANLGTSGGINAGNIVYSSGFTLTGAGAGTTNFFLTPGFPETGTCTNGMSGKALWVIPLQGEWADLQITGGGNFVATGISTNGCNIVEADGPASLRNFVATNFGERGSSNTPTNGVGAYLWTQLNHVNLSAFGTQDVATNVSSSITAIQLWVENVGTTGISLGTLTDYYSQTVSQFSKYNFICYDCTVDVENLVDPNTVPFLFVNKGLNAKWYRGGLSTVAGTYNSNNFVGYYCEQNGCTLDVQDAFFDLSQPSTGTGYIAVQCANTCTNHFENSIFKGTSGGFGYKDVAGSALYDMGGNTFGAVSIAGSVYGSASITGTTLVTGNVVLTSGWGTGAAASAFLGNSLAAQWTTTIGTGPGAGAITTVTFPTPFLVAPTCSAQVVGGTSTTVLPVECSATTTAATLTYVGTFVSGTVITRLTASN